MSTLNVENLSDGTDSVPIGDVINGSARAWVNFDGTGTVAIRDSYNVSSITDQGTGNYDVNFATAMPDGNYATAGIAGTPSAQRLLRGAAASFSTTTETRVLTITSSFSNADSDMVCVIVLGN